MSTPTSTITVKVEDASSRDRQLEQASSLLRENATDCGILVTRIDLTTFTIALSPDIPFGFTREVDAMKGAAMRAPGTKRNRTAPHLMSWRNREASS